ncbi:MAG: 50S ribosomal protein L11 methyltransferase [Chitinophagales bacterium]
MSIYIEISIPVKNDPESDILVAQLSRIGFEGFEEEENLLHAFIPEALYDETRLRRTIMEAKGLKEDIENHFSVKQIQPKNWNEEWEKDFIPVILDDFCAIRADFHQKISTVQYELIITPKMSFGTGHHATTYMMLEAMRSLDFYAENVLDFGTGTGVLAILAEKMGSVNVRALDNDSWSMENARENMAANQTRHISLEQKDSLDEESVFDIILANINLQVILQNMGAFRQHLDENGVMIGSGVLMEDEDKIRQSAAEEGFLMNILFTRDNWMSFSLKKRAISS